MAKKSIKQAARKTKLTAVEAKATKTAKLPKVTKEALKRAKLIPADYVELDEKNNVIRGSKKPGRPFFDVDVAPLNSLTESVRFCNAFSELYWEGRNLKEATIEQRLGRVLPKGLEIVRVTKRPFGFRVKTGLTKVEYQVAHDDEWISFARA